MWIFKNDAFVSIVEDRYTDDQLWVRARIRGDLERFFEGTPFEPDVIETPDADYRFRVCVNRQMVITAMSTALESIDYDNFKKSIATDVVNEERHTVYMRVWTAMMTFQRWALGREEKAERRKK